VLRHLLIRVCALLVPAAMRPRWREEWLAELEASPRPFDPRALGAVRDAIDARSYSSSTAVGRGFNRAAPVFSGLWFDIRSGIRQLQRHRGFTALSVCVLALGIGINSAIFSVVYTVFFKPWPIEKPEDVVFVYRNTSYGSFHEASIGHEPTVEEFLAASPGIASLGGFWGRHANVEIGGVTERTWGELVSTNYFDVLGIRPVVGRTFSAADNETNPETVVVISHALWRERFQSRPDVVGQRVLLNKRDATIVGVVEPRFHGLSSMWTRASWWTVGEQFMRGWDRRRRWSGSPFARLKAGVSLEQATASANILGARLNETVRQSVPREALPRGAPYFRLERVNSIREPHFPERTLIPRPLAVALGAVAVMVLIIATVNITGLMLARGMSRTVELATRQALGVTPWRMARQLMTESVLLAFGGGVLGLVLAWNLLGLFNAVTPDRYALGATVDATVAAFIAVVCLGTGVTVGLAPLRQAQRVEVLPALCGSMHQSGTQRRRRRHWVVVPQVALSLVLLIVSGVHVRALRQVEGTPIGYDPDAITVLTLSMDNDDYGERRRPRQSEDAITLEYQTRYRALYNTLRAQAGAQVGLMSEFPEQVHRSHIAQTARGETPAGSPAVPVQIVTVSPGTFATLGLQIRAGRDFDDSDTRQGRAVAVVSEAAASRLWPGQDAVGQRLGAVQPDREVPKVDWYEVVGVVGNTASVLANPDPPVRVYSSLGQSWRPSASRVLVRSANRETVPQVRAAIDASYPRLSVVEVNPMTSYLDELLYPRRMAASILGGSGLIGLGLACIGLYAVVAFSVARRRRELGIRATLGARPGDLVRLVLGEGGRMSAIGSVIGLAGGIAALRYTAHLSQGVPSADILVFALMPAVLAAVVLLACYLPARRAGLIDPVETLRE
jgi:putative ABC transport system permease protein